MPDINPTDATTASIDSLRNDRYDSTLEQADLDAILAHQLEAIQSTGWSTPTATLARAALADGASATVVLQTLAALVTDLKAKGILTA